MSHILLSYRTLETLTGGTVRPIPRAVDHPYYGGQTVHSRIDLCSTRRKYPMVRLLFSPVPAGARYVFNVTDYGYNSVARQDTQDDNA